MIFLSTLKEGCPARNTASVHSTPSDQMVGLLSRWSWGYTIASRPRVTLTLPGRTTRAQRDTQRAEARSSQAFSRLYAMKIVCFSPSIKHCLSRSSIGLVPVTYSGARAFSYLDADGELRDHAPGVGADDSSAKDPAPRILLHGDLGETLLDPLALRAIHVRQVALLFQDK